ncbi:hypothetical protein C7A09_28420, partial [Pseudomonas fluorescens]
FVAILARLVCSYATNVDLAWPATGSPVCFAAAQQAKLFHLLFFPFSIVFSSVRLALALIHVLQCFSAVLYLLVFCSP